MVRQRRLIAAVLAIGLIATAGSCGREAGSTDGMEPVARTDDVEPDLPAQRGGHLAYAIETDPNGLEPTRNAFDPVGIQLANALYDPLAAFDSTGVARPYLAQSIEPVTGSDFTRWRIVLRPGVRFQSGKPLDAVALKTYLDALAGTYIDPASGAKRPSVTQDAVGYVAGVDVLDVDIVQIRMKKPWATFPAILTGQGGYVISRQQLDDPNGHSHPDGTGPFRLRSWDAGRRFAMVRNPDYWRAGLPYLDGVDFVVDTDGTSRIESLQRGSIDVFTVGYASEVARLDEIAKGQRASGSPVTLRLERDPNSSEAISIMLNTAKKPLDSVDIRRALAHATDVEAVARETGWPRDRIITGPFDASSRWYTPTDAPRFDLARARRLVEDYRRRERVDTVTVELMGAYEPRMLQSLKDQWAKAGITVRVTMTEFQKAVPISVAGAYEALQFRYFNAVDPDTLYHFWTSETKRPVGQISLNLNRFSNEAIDAGLAQARSTTDEAVRRAGYAAVQREFAAQVPYVWLFRTEWVVARTNRVHNARNVTLPDGRTALPFDNGTYRLTETWVS